MMSSVLDLSEVDEQALLPSETFDQTKADLQMEAILTGVQSEAEGSSNSDQLLEMPTNGNLYCPVTEEQRDGMLDTILITGTTLIIHRGTLLPDALKEKVLSSMRDNEWDKFSALLNYYLRLKGYETITKREMMDVAGRS